ncbi:MAG: hypothetical protein K8S98_02280 [Planctomycetes bacterium]|nr:hypothetical protein [Planctomycetota bacterium]
MFCQKCGTANTDTATLCSSCATAFGLAVPTGSPAVTDTVKAASRDAFAAFKTLAANPVGALPAACATLGDAKALRSGVAFGVVSVLCFASAGPILLGVGGIRLSDLYEQLGFGGVLKYLAFAAIPFVGLTLGSVGARKFLGGKSALGSDCFLAGAALLPASLCMLAASLLGFEHFELIGILAVFAMCLGVLMLYSGYTRITQLTERAASLSVPVVVLLTVWLAKLMLGKVLGGPSGGGFSY